MAISQDWCLELESPVTWRRFQVFIFLFAVKVFFGHFPRLVFGTGKPSNLEKVPSFQVFVLAAGAGSPRSGNPCKLDVLGKGISSLGWIGQGDTRQPIINLELCLGKV